MENTKSKRKESKFNPDIKLKSPLFKIVLVGDSDVGKTSIIQTFIVIKDLLINLFLFLENKFRKKI